MLRLLLLMAFLSFFSLSRVLLKKQLKKAAIRIFRQKVQLPQKVTLYTFCCLSRLLADYWGGVPIVIIYVRTFAIFPLFDETTTHPRNGERTVSCTLKSF